MPYSKRMGKGAQGAEGLHGHGWGYGKLSFKQSRSTLSYEHKLTTEDHWAPHRAMLYRLIHESNRVDLVVALATILNLMIVILQTDLQADGKQDMPLWMRVVALITVSFFVLESAGRIYVHRSQVCSHPMYIFDMIVTVIDLLLVCFTSVFDFIPMLSLLRFWRMLRLIHILLKMDAFRELYLMINGLRAALKSLVWAAAIIGATLVFCSILAVQLIHPLNKEIAASGLYDECERCPRAFASVWQSTLTFIQQIIAGDSWGYVTLRVIDAYPLSALFFFPVFLAIDLALMNLVLMVVVDQAEEARARDAKRSIIDKEKAMTSAKSMLYQICIEMDDDGNGSLTLQELTSGAEKNESFKDILRVMDIGISDLETVFAILDEDESGTVEYSEFCDQLHKMKTDDSHTMLVIMRHQLKQVMMDIKKELSLSQSELQLHQQELKLLQTDYMQKFNNQERILNKIERLLEKEGQEIADITTSISGPKLSNLIAPPPNGNTDALRHQLLDENKVVLDKQISLLKAWISQELTPILHDELVPILQDVKGKLDDGYGPTPNGLAEISSSTPCIPWTCGGCKTPPTIRVSAVSYDDASALQNMNHSKSAREKLLPMDNASAGQGVGNCKHVKEKGK